MRTLAAALVVAVALTSIVRNADAFVIYRAEGTSNLGSSPPFGITEGTTPPVTRNFGDFSFNGRACPAVGTPNFACARVFAQADLVQGRRVVLRAAARLTRTDTDGVAPLELVAATADVQLFNIGTVTSSPVGTAYVQLALSGTESATTTAPGRILPEAFHTVRVNGALTECSVGTLCTVEVPEWSSEYLRMTLRTDARVTNPEYLSFAGWSAEMVSDFSNTLELVAIELYDTNGNFIPDAQVIVGDGMGGTLFEIPTSVEATTTTTSTPTTSTSVTTSTLPLRSDHRCYPARTAKGTPKFVSRTVRLTDVFEDKNVVVGAVSSLCNPTAGDASAHRTCHAITDAKGEPKFAGRDVATSDDLGALTLRLARATTLCLPSVPSDGDLKCYPAKPTKGARPFVPRTVTVSDRFETKDVVVTKPYAVCTSVARSDEHLVCYATKDAKKQPAFAKRTVPVVSRFGELTVEVKKANRLCLPASVTPY